MSVAEPEDVCHLRGFEDLVYDAVHLLYMAADVDVETDERGYEFTFVRSSVLNSLLLLECGANCCLDSLNLSGRYANDVDKLPVLSKYEFFVRSISPKTEFDRGCYEVQCATEVTSLRDRCVHPKVRKQPFTEIADGVREADFGVSEYLGVPVESTHWKPKHAATVLRSANNFLNLVLLNWCALDTDTVCDILLGYREAEIPSRSSVAVDCIGGLDRAVRDWDIDFKFLGKTV